MAFSAFSDLFTMTISNRVSLLLIAGFAVMAALIGMSCTDVLSHTGAGLAVLAVTFTLFACGWIGGGDAKLAAATALWLGFDPLMEYLLVRLDLRRHADATDHAISPDADAVDAARPAMGGAPAPGRMPACPMA